MPGVIVIYLSTSGNTKAMADAIVEGASSRNVDAKAVNFNETKMEEIKAADAIAIGSSTFNYKMLPPMEKFLQNLEKAKRKRQSRRCFWILWLERGSACNDRKKKMRELGMKVLDPVCAFNINLLKKI